MFEDLFQNKKVIPEKLESYGFYKDNGVYKYATTILDGEFRLEIIVSEDSLPEIKLTERESDEEYVLYKTNFVGKYVETVRNAIKIILLDIEQKCYEMVAFKAKQSSLLITYIREKYGDELEYLWEKFPNNAIWRRKDNHKWYAALLTLSRRKLGMPSDETIEIIDLRGNPHEVEQSIDNKFYFPAWHMNKKHWYTIVLDGSVSMIEICQRVDESVSLAK